MVPTVKTKKRVIIVLAMTLLMSCNPFEDSVPLTDVEIEMKKIDDGTLLGPDKNNNGIRDDIEYWIENSTLVVNNDIKRAAMLYAKLTREHIRLVDNKEKSIENFYSMNHSSSCLVDVSAHANEELDIFRLSGPIYKYSVNTKERYLKTRRADGYISGRAIRRPNFATEACAFKLEEKGYLIKKGHVSKENKGYITEDKQESI